MNKLITSALLTCALTTGVAYATVTLSPNQNNGSGQIPSGYSDITFALSQGNSVSQIYFPSNPAIGDKVTISYTGGNYPILLDASNTDIPLESLSLYHMPQGSYVFNYNPYNKGWVYQPAQVALTNNIIPINNTQRIYEIKINDANWQPQFDFAVDSPSSSNDAFPIKTLVKVTSMASQPVSIKSNNTLYPGGNFILNKNESLWFEYLPRTQKWVRVGFDMGLKNSIAGLPTTFDSRFYANYIQGAVVDHVLPSAAEDRAEAFVGANSIARSENPVFSNVNTSQPYTINTLDLKDKNTNRTLSLFTKNKTLIRYMYVADRQHWVPMSLKPVDYSSRITHESTNFISYFSSPLVYVKFDNLNYVSDLNLSVGNGFKHSVILENTTNQSINVALGQGRSEKLLPGEKARFQFDSNGFNPVKVTHTIDLLLVNNPAASDAIGVSAAKIRFLESVATANQIAENSNANVYIRVAGYLERTMNGMDISAELMNQLRTDTVVQAELARLKADGVYYQTKSGNNLCGIANIAPSGIYNMQGVIGYDCALGTMAHEFGHNLGLYHTEDTGFSLSTEYKKGFSVPFLGATVMGYRGLGSIPYYSSPNLYHPRYLFRMGDKIESDNVRQINEYAPIISAFATATQ